MRSRCPVSRPLSRTLAQDQSQRASRLLDFYFEGFGRDCFFFDLQDHAIPELETISKSLTEVAPHCLARFVATSDVHCPGRDDAPLQDILLCVQTAATLDDPNRMGMSDDSSPLRTAKKMRVLFAHVPGVIENNLWTAERCQVSLESNRGEYAPAEPERARIVGSMC